MSPSTETTKKVTSDGEHRRRRRFILVHGACHGAWCWYKLAALLEEEDDEDISVTAVDLAASGVNTAMRLDELRSPVEYARPLLDTVAAVPEGEKAVLVGHSMGGMSVALAMEAFPEKIAVGVFATAVLPAPGSSVTDCIAKTLQSSPATSTCEFVYGDGPENPPTSLAFGPSLMPAMYRHAPLQDLKLAASLVRPTRLFNEPSYEGSWVTAERYGSVPRVYVVCKEDEVLTEDMQRSFVAESPVEEVVEVEEAGHMVMLSRPRELLQTLLAVSDKYA